MRVSIQLLMKCVCECWCAIFTAAVVVDRSTDHCWNAACRSFVCFSSKTVEARYYFSRVHLTPKVAGVEKSVKTTVLNLTPTTQRWEYMPQFTQSQDVCSSRVIVKSFTFPSFIVLLVNSLNIPDVYFLNVHIVWDIPGPLMSLLFTHVQLTMKMYLFLQYIIFPVCVKLVTYQYICVCVL